jgi:hypothetical protein
MTPASERRTTAMQAGLVLDAMIGRLGYDEKFVAAVNECPATALAEAGLVLDKDAVEEFVLAEPDRFDVMCDALCRLVSPDFLAAMVPGSRIP